MRVSLTAQRTESEFCQLRLESLDGEPISPGFWILSREEARHVACLLVLGARLAGETVEYEEVTWLE